MTRPTLALLAALAAIASAPIAAQPLVDLDVVDRDRGQWLPRYPHRGDTWIAGTPGHRYGVRLSNSSGERVLVVLSVDGVNAVTGETAAPSQAGYVLGPWESAEIDGWRKSLGEVARFVFTDLPDAYAARTGRPDNVGVIGIAVFREARASRDDAPPPRAAEVPGVAAGNAARAAGSAEAQADAMDDARGGQRLGTGHGAREWAPVGRTGFIRASAAPVQVTQLRYDDRESLVALGVLPRARPWRARPDAFPAGFVPDPPRW